MAAESCFQPSPPPSFCRPTALQQRQHSTHRVFVIHSSRINSIIHIVILHFQIFRQTSDTPPYTIQLSGTILHINIKPIYSSGRGLRSHTTNSNITSPPLKNVDRIQEMGRIEDHGKLCSAKYGCSSTKELKGNVVLFNILFKKNQAKKFF